MDPPRDFDASAIPGTMLHHAVWAWRGLQRQFPKIQAELGYRRRTRRQSMVRPAIPAESEGYCDGSSSCGGMFLLEGFGASRRLTTAKLGNGEKEWDLRMDFWKMNGAGNDFIILQDMDCQLNNNDLPIIAKTLCRRHLSVGADGLMVVRPAMQQGDFRMIFLNSDGSLGEMCGNGVRCICRYGYEQGLSSIRQSVETASGLVEGRRIDKRNYQVQLNLPTVLWSRMILPLKDVQLQCAYLELGDPGLPHAVVEYGGLRKTSLEKLRPLAVQCRNHPLFPKGANVTFYEVEGADRLWAVTFERGVEDFTYACGTGAASAAAVLTLQGRVSGDVTVDMPGGRLSIHVETGANQIEKLLLTGPTNIVCIGTIIDEDLQEAIHRAGA